VRQLKAGDRFFRGKNVRLISQTNEQVGIVSFETALARAEAAGYDLVEVQSKTEPPVCRIMDFGKYQFDEAKRQRENRKAQIQPKLKEIKLHANIDENDFQIKLKRVVDFLTRGDKVRVLLAFRGREMTHTEIGQQVIDRMLKSVEEIANIDNPPKMLGKSIIAVLSVKPQFRKERKASEKYDDDDDDDSNDNSDEE